MINWALEILIILLLLIANGVFAMAEIAVVSARRTRLQQLADEGDPRARSALELATHPNLFLATVQVGITLVGILAGAFGGATLAREIAGGLRQVALLAPYAETLGVAIIVVVLTYFSLIIGELVPKRLALADAERSAAALAQPMLALSRFAAPIVRLLSASTDLVVRLLGVRASRGTAVTEEEIKVLIDQGRMTGVIAVAEQDMIESVLALGDRRVSSVMTPRTHISWLDIADPPEAVRAKAAVAPYSRLPVISGSLDNVLGIVRTRDLLTQSLSGAPLDLRAVMRPALFVPEGMPVLRVLELFKSQRGHAALVTDEYGGIQGMVTPNDLLEAIVGYLPAPEDVAAGPGMVRRADGVWLLDGLLPIDQLKRLMGVERLPDQAEGRYQTVGGFVMSQTGSVPSTGQTFRWKGALFEVVKMDGRRVAKVLVTLAPAGPGGQPAGRRLKSE